MAARLLPQPVLQHALLSTAHRRHTLSMRSNSAAAGRQRRSHAPCSGRRPGAAKLAAQEDTASGSASVTTACTASGQGSCWHHAAQTAPDGHQAVALPLFHSTNQACTALMAHPNRRRSRPLAPAAPRPAPNTAPGTAWWRPAAPPLQRLRSRQVCLGQGRPAA